MGFGVGVGCGRVEPAAVVGGCAILSSIKTTTTFYDR